MAVYGVCVPLVTVSCMQGSILKSCFLEARGSVLIGWSYVLYVTVCYLCCVVIGVDSQGIMIMYTAQFLLIVVLQHREYLQIDWNSDKIW
jgi:hypothetical protein